MPLKISQIVIHLDQNEAASSIEYKVNQTAISDDDAAPIEVPTINQNESWSNLTTKYQSETGNVFPANLVARLVATCKRNFRDRKQQG